MTLIKNSQSVRTYCTRNGISVGSDIGIGSWRVSIPIQELIDRLNAEGGTDSALWLLRGDSHGYFSKVAQA